MTIAEIERALARLPRKLLCSFETPVERLYRLEEELNAGPVYIKRDDLNGLGPGGNKVRPLEYLLGEAMERRCDTIIASGMENSNLCSIAAAACCRLGLRCVLVHNNPEPQARRGNMVLNQLAHVEEHYIGSVSETERSAYVDRLAEELRAQGAPPWVIENGATTPRGAVGYIHLPLELYRHMEERPITDLFVPGGNGGLAAGVVFGTALLGAPFHVHVITVENPAEELEGILNGLFQGMTELTGLQPKIPVQRAMTVHGDYRGGGWGISTAQSDGMVEHLAQTEGIFLERVYTGKTVWGMCDLLKSGAVKSEGACVVHSGGFASLFYQYS